MTLEREIVSTSHQFDTSDKRIESAPRAGTKPAFWMRMLESAPGLTEHHETRRATHFARPAVRWGLDTTAITACLEACLACEQACNAYADACLHEVQQGSAKRVRECLGCAELSAVSAQLLGRPWTCDSDALIRQLEFCASACDTCVAECRDFEGMLPTSKLVADTCRRCAESCRKVQYQLVAPASDC